MNNLTEKYIRGVLYSLTIDDIALRTDYSIDFLRELNKFININNLFITWYSEWMLNYPTENWKDMTFECYLKKEIPQYKEFWRDLI